MRPGQLLLGRRSRHPNRCRPRRPERLAVTDEEPTSRAAVAAVPQRTSARAPAGPWHARTRAPHGRRGLLGHGVAAELSPEAKRLDLGDVESEHRDAADDLKRALRAVSRRGRAADRSVAVSVRADHREYLRSVDTCSRRSTLASPPALSSSRSHRSTRSSRRWKARCRSGRATTGARRARLRRDRKHQRDDHRRHGRCHSDRVRPPAPARWAPACLP